MERRAMRLRSRSTPLVALIALAVVAVRAVCAGAPSATLPLNVAPTLGEVQPFFPDVTRRDTQRPRPGRARDAEGHDPRRVHHHGWKENGHLDRRAVCERISRVRGVQSIGGAGADRCAPVALPRRIGQRSFSVVGAQSASAAVGALDGALVVQASLKGYRPDQKAVENLAALARMADELATAALL